jgi:uncharacterized protein YodC (DUF2158 family)
MANQINPGDKVKLISGSVQMTVGSVLQGEAYCFYYDGTKNEIIRVLLPLAALVTSS